MKPFLILFFLLLTACGGSGGGTEAGGIDDGTPEGIPPTCKNLYSVWQSISDLEMHDFSNLYGGGILQEYEYKAYDGVTCGYVSNPNHNLTAQILSAASLGLTVPWEYQLKMRYSLAMGGQCATYQVPGSIGAKDQVAYIVMTSCNEIQICEDAFASALGSCKIFR